ncbi:MAG: SDR family NAD(P)-dependent oxidoreductase [Candidatus Gastranaerophilales bacterium]|nr:SDR family NAD(P)-dependent oxidoreductase [Candidatus Gastranaerophilales bacterium]
MKNILITGASRGIGKAIAKGLGDKYNLFLTSRNEELLKTIAAETGAKAYFVGDLSSQNDLAELAKFIKVNSIDILINNAGEYIYGGIEEVNYEQISRIFDVNLLAPAYLCSIAVKNMKKNGWGRIINIGSISGVMGEAYASAYSSSKAGLIGLTKSLALELAQYNITVNIINPGWVETEMGLKSIEESGFSLEETFETIPQKRFIQPEEIEKLVEYLISQDAKGLTGQSINLCAGLSLGV